MPIAYCTAYCIRLKERPAPYLPLRCGTGSAPTPKRLTQLGSFTLPRRPPPASSPAASPAAPRAAAPCARAAAGAAAAGRPAAAGRTQTRRQPPRPARGRGAREVWDRSLGKWVPAPPCTCASMHGVGRVWGHHPRGGVPAASRRKHASLHASLGAPCHLAPCARGARRACSVRDGGRCSSRAGHVHGPGPRPDPQDPPLPPHRPIQSFIL
jgi:hypothetical protein